MTNKADILVFVETTGDAHVSAGHELLAIARGLAGNEGTVSALVVGDPAAACIAQLPAYGADRVFVAPSQDSQSYLCDVWLDAATELLKSVSPRCVLLPHSDLGSEAGPRLAFRLQTSVATGCERVERAGDEIAVTRPCYGNKAREVLLLHAQPAIATVKARASDPLTADPSRTGAVIELRLPQPRPQTPRVLERRQDDVSEGVRLQAAKVVVAGGRGLGGPEGFELLQQFAAVLDGAVGASRVACDLEWCPRSWQIGLSGKTVAPDLYVAVGISGAGQHMAGCGKAKSILAINSDSEASIFKDASFGVVGDYRQIVPHLIEAIARQRSA